MYGVSHEGLFKTDGGVNIYSHRVVFKSTSYYNYIY